MICVLHDSYRESIDRNIDSCELRESSPVHRFECTQDPSGLIAVRFADDSFNDIKFRNARCTQARE